MVKQTTPKLTTICENTPLSRSWSVAYAHNQAFPDGGGRAPTGKGNSPTREGCEEEEEENGRRQATAGLNRNNFLRTVDHIFI